MTLPETWGVPLAVSALLLGTLLLAALYRRHEIHRAALRAAVGRVERGLLQRVEALDTLRGVVSLSRELRVVLRADVLARYRQIARLLPRYPTVRARVAEAEGLELGADHRRPRPDLLHHDHLESLVGQSQGRI